MLFKWWLTIVTHFMNGRYTNTDLSVQMSWIRHTLRIQMLWEVYNIFSDMHNFEVFMN